MSYNLEDPEDTQRFKLNLMVSDLLSTMREHTSRIGKLTEPKVAYAFITLATALYDLLQVTKPKDD